jgi:uncharacterized protein YndB with AHSA1/START domain
MSQTAQQPVTQPTTESSPPRKRFSMTKKVLIGLALVLAAFAVVVAMQPADMHVARSMTIDAPSDAVFAQVNDFRNWQAWSPWEKLDPNLQRTYSGAESGKGAVYHWSGNAEVGEGQMTIEESRPNELIHIRLEFLKPFAATNAAEFTFAPQGDGTEVTWTMTGEKNFVCKGMCLFMDMDAMIGADFEKGLAQLKDVAETE